MVVNTEILIFLSTLKFYILCQAGYNWFLTAGHMKLLFTCQGELGQEHSLFLMKYIFIYLFILLWVWGKKKIKAPQEDKISYVPRIRLGDLAR